MKRPALALLLSAFLAVAVAQQTPPTDPAPPEVPVTDVQPLPEPQPAPDPGLPIEPAPAPSEPPVEPAPVEPIPALPTPIPALPEPTPTPQPAPTPPLPSTTVPAQPVPVPAAPTPGVTAPAAPKPAPPAPPAVPAAPLTLVLDVPLKLLEDGQPVAGSNRQTFVIPTERAAILRRGGTVTASLDADLKAFARKVGSTPQDARFEEFASGWALVQRDGVTVDLDKSRSALLAALKNPASKTVTLSYTTTAPARTLNYFTSRGVTTFLATGQTNYYGSSRARITNIHVGASRFKDRLFEGGSESRFRMRLRK